MTGFIICIIKFSVENKLFYEQKNLVILHHSYQSYFVVSFLHPLKLEIYLQNKIDKNHELTLEIPRSKSNSLMTTDTLWNPKSGISWLKKKIASIPPHHNILCCVPWFKSLTTNKSTIKNENTENQMLKWNNMKIFHPKVS